VSIGERITDLFLRNPVAWVLLALLIVASYWNYEHLKELDAVCDAIKMPDDGDLPDKPKTLLEKAQVICASLEDEGNPYAQDSFGNDMPTGRR
jgi:hypothetical protein